MLIASKHKNLVDKTIRMIKNKYKLKHLGFPSKFLEYKLEKRQDGSIFPSPKVLYRRQIKAVQNGQLQHGGDPDAPISKPCSEYKRKA